ncbi:MAG TPA: NAD-dependent epimerase/dehydratase family protein [Actinomycetota bacterium]|nr:NAD-dependent epimerase/dehydratase family protein [Actinomycetota bacterium]
MTTEGLTVAVTGPTGSIGKAFVRALEIEPTVAHIRGMARRPIDPAEHGWNKTEYLQGDILDKDAVEALVDGADVVVHLAFLIFGPRKETHGTNLEGSSNVFIAALDAGADRLVYTSSVAAYGFHEDNPLPLHEDVRARGTEEHHYSAQKAELEATLARLASGRDTDVYVFRPCIVAGPTALDLIDKIPYVKVSERLPDRVKAVVGSVRLLRPVIPDPGVPFQLVHEDDVAQALVAAVLGRGEPGTYNLAGDGSITATDLAHALGWYAMPVPEFALDTTVKIISRFPLLPASASWLHSVRVPVLMDTEKAKTKLGWRPRYDSIETLQETVAAARDQGLIAWSDKVN